MRRAAETVTLASRVWGQFCGQVPRAKGSVESPITGPVRGLLFDSSEPWGLKSLLLLAPAPWHMGQGGAGRGAAPRSGPDTVKETQDNMETLGKTV